MKDGAQYHGCLGRWVESCIFYESWGETGLCNSRDDMPYKEFYYFKTKVLALHVDLCWNFNENHTKFHYALS